VGANTDLTAVVRLPALPVDASTMTVGGAVMLAVTVLVTALAAALGGKLGERFHRRVDRAAGLDLGSSPAEGVPLRRAPRAAEVAPQPSPTTSTSLGHEPRGQLGVQTPAAAGRLVLDGDVQVGLRPVLRGQLGGERARQARRRSLSSGAGHVVGHPHRASPAPAAPAR
jgi:hypothetical protein